MSLLFNMLSRLAIAFHPRSIHLLITHKCLPSHIFFVQSKTQVMEIFWNLSQVAVKFITQYIDLISFSIVFNMLSWQYFANALKFYFFHLLIMWKYEWINIEKHPVKECTIMLTAGVFKSQCIFILCALNFSLRYISESHN